MDLDRELVTTVVGSYPASPTRGSLANSYFTHVDPYIESIEESVQAQLDAGIQLVSDGQTRNDMVELFAADLKGFRIKEMPEIISKIEHTEPITVSDQVKIKNGLPEEVGLKGIITGPWTLVNSSKDLHYRDKKEAVMDLAGALHREAELLDDVCDVIQLDEPFLSVEYPEYAEETVETVLDVEKPTALHVCGNAVDVVPELVNIDVDILDNEFASNPKMYDVYRDISFEQRLAPGVVTTKAPAESVETIVERINRAVDEFGTSILIDPDCGLKHLSKEVADKKLKNMVQARDVVLDERS